MSGCYSGLDRLCNCYFRVSADEMARDAPGVSLITFFEKPR